MSPVSPANTQRLIERTGLIPLFFNPDAEVSRSVAKAVFDAGCPILEFTNRGEGALESFLGISELVIENEMQALLGVGSLHDPKIAEPFLDSCPAFAVGPSFNKDLAAECQARGILYIPGCATPTEVMAAADSGHPLIKIFPAGLLGGPDYIKALRGPMPWLKAIPTGGVAPVRDNLLGWFESGVVAVGMGSNLIGGQAVAARDYAGLTSAIKGALELIAEVRSAA